MDEKTCHTLEFDKVLQLLAGYTAFPASTEKALALAPASHIDEAYRRQTLTSEARQLLITHPDLTIGGARDIRQAVELARHSGVLTPTDFLDIKSTLVAARNLSRTFEKNAFQYPGLNEIACRLPHPSGLVDAISHAISDHGEILDSASPKLSNIRSELGIARERLLGKLQRMVTDQKFTPFLQEALITQRDGRYVLPLRSEFKGRIKSIVHDQSSSGATLFIEPLGVVELNNQNRQLQLDERDEERRILAELSDQVRSHAEEISQTVDVLAELDLVLACARYAETINATEPVLHPLPPRKISAEKSHHPGSRIRLQQAWHPLLNPQTVVPIDVELDDQTYALVVTGPNTGGKTVTLKTIGLIALMAQAGLHIPAHSGSEISVFQDIFADIGDEQSIEQSLSTFSSHITNIIRILKKSDYRSLVILDELGAGTDPQEGAALARALLTNLLDHSVTTLVTTHHPELKAFAHVTPGVVNASVEFDLESLRPTYHLVIGIPGRSNALSIAERLGLPQDIIASARADLTPEDLHADDLLDEIHRQRDLSRKARIAADSARQEAEKLRAELIEKMDHIEDERQTILENARLEAEEKIQDLEDELREARCWLTRQRQPAETLKPVEEKIEELQIEVEKPVRRRKNILVKQTRPLQPGDKVRVRSLNVKAVVNAISDEDVEVQVGALRIRSRLDDLEFNAPLETISKPAAPTPAVKPVEVDVPGIELDLRGQRADDALDMLERHLDSAFIAGMPFIRIIHGKGTGRLRAVIREALEHHPQVKSYESGHDKEGGEGVTVAKLSS
ncbi:MAG: endonuclease MutS2 [Anaerolineales bacterium]|nr:endonuclease MutS2 [Anaerolineales bacterium]